MKISVGERVSDDHRFELQVFAIELDVVKVVCLLYFETEEEATKYYLDNYADEPVFYDIEEVEDES